MSSDAIIINAITGESVATNVKFFTSLEEFKSFISQKWNIPTDQLLLLLPFGNKLKASSFKECLRNASIGDNEFYVYDRRCFSIVNGPNQVELNQEYCEQLNERVEDLLDSLTNRYKSKDESTLFKPIESPLIDADLKLENLSARVSTSLLTTNLGWLSALEIDVHYFRKLIQDSVSQTLSILKCLAICEQYLKVYCFDVEKLYNSNAGFLDQLATNGFSMKWRDCYNKVLPKLNGLDGSLQQYADKNILENDEVTLKSLDQRINDKLKTIKKELDENADSRFQLSKNIELLRKDMTPENKIDHLEKMMLDKFDEIVQATREKSRQILEQDYLESSTGDLTGVHSYLSELKSSVAGKLLTIANSIYSQAETILEHKRVVQKKSLVMFGQIAFLQVEALGVKKVLLNDCNRDLESYQNLELQFARIEDLPLIYGLYLIERYRRQFWFLEVSSNAFTFSEDLKNALNKEKRARTQWLEKFGSITTLFFTDLENSPDVDQLNQLQFGGSFEKKGTSEEYTQDTRESMHHTLQIIESYMTEVKSLNISKEVLNLLNDSLSEANNLKSVFSDRLANSLSTPAAKQIEGYKARIKKLESLLHDTKYSDPIHWPSGLLNTTYMQPFRSNLSTVSSRVALNSSGLLDTSSSTNLSKVMELQTQLRQLQTTIEGLRSDKQLAEQRILNANNKVTDLELEKTAFRESLTHLNNEFARITEEEESRKDYLAIQQSNFKKELQNLMNENKELVKELQSSTEKSRNLEKERNDFSLKIEKLKQDFQKEKEALDLRANELLEQKKLLEQNVASLNKINGELQQKDETCYMDKLTQTLDPEKNGQAGATSTAYQQFCQSLEAKMFQVFTSDVFILENIGLLLAFDDENQFRIKRVKGLKKGQNPTILDESTQIPENDTVLKSSVFRTIKQSYSQLQNSQKLQEHDSFIFDLNRIYDEKLFENAVIQRFKDIEFLAKKLTKENKKKKGILDNLQNERLALNSFQIGDLALFLPTKENIPYGESSESSLTSSFSSVDLSTPPPLDANALSSTTKREKGLKMKKHSPWAAFTAFEGNTRYFLKDEDALTKGREWFVGKISSLECHVVDGQSYNPYKLAKGTAWFHVTATMVSLPG